MTDTPHAPTPDTAPAARLPRAAVLAVNLLGLVVLATMLVALRGVWAAQHLTFRYTIAAQDAESRHVNVRLDVTGVVRPRLRLRALEGAVVPEIDGVRASGAFGIPLPARVVDGVIEVTTFCLPRVAVACRVRPGALARHGHQGWATRTHVIVPAYQLLRVPETAADLADLAVRVQAPRGWSAALPWDARDEEWFDPRLAGRWLRESLQGSTVALGTFDRRVFDVGGNRLVVHLWAEWPRAQRDGMAERTRALFAALHEALHFRLPGPYTVVLVPDAPDHAGVLGGYWSNGQGASHDDSPRAWRLLAHRMAHALNRDVPTGLAFAPHPRYLATRAAVNWVNEGTAGFLEAWMADRAGIAPMGGSVAEWFDRYTSVHGAASETGVPLAREPSTHDPDAIEFLHYVAAPLAMVELDGWIRRATRGRGSLLHLLARAYAAHGGHRGAVDFFAEVAAEWERDPTPWFDAVAAGNDTLLPLCDPLLAFHAAGQRLPTPGTGDLALPADQAWMRMAQQYPRDAERLAREADRLVDEHWVREELERVRPGAFPAELVSALPGMPERWQRRVAWRAREMLVRAFEGSRDEAGQRRLDAHLARLRTARGLPPSRWLRVWSETPSESSSRTAVAEIPAALGGCAARWARDAARFYVETGRLLDVTRLPADPACPNAGPLSQRAATFVTLLRGRETRGCMGTVDPVRPLWADAVIEAARASAHDPRYAPVTPDELDTLVVHVSVLSELRPLSHPDAFRPGVDGLVLDADRHTGLFLPEVAVQNGWDRARTFAEIGRKAGLGDDAWRAPGARLRVFTTQAFDVTPVPGSPSP